MKSLKIVIAIALFCSLAFAQERPYTKEDWQRDFTQLTTEKQDLTGKVQNGKTENQRLKDQFASMKTEDQAMEELYQLVGATKEDVDVFRSKLADLEGKIQNKTPEKADRQAEIANLKSSKISALPEFFDRTQKGLDRGMEAWKQEEVKKQEEEKAKVKEYSVVRGDCLWNIAKKKDIYGNALAWPNIYKANRDQIKNPNLIFPKQTFKIPPLSEEEKARYEKLKTNYKPAPKAK